VLILWLEIGSISLSCGEPVVWAARRGSPPTSLAKTGPLVGILGARVLARLVVLVVLAFGLARRVVISGRRVVVVDEAVNRR
jgi:hypothetical protein